MSRSRPYKKNDNAWVEQRNWTHVRKVVGYRRMDSQAELEVLHELYEKLCQYKNFFQPTMKLIGKVREGGKLRRNYDVPRTPYQRLLESGQLRPAVEKRLQQQYDSLNMAELHRQVEQLRNRLFDLIEGKPVAAPATAKSRGPAIRVTSRAHAVWMQQMLGRKQ